MLDVLAGPVRQGDVLLRPTDVPSDAAPVELADDRLVLAYGEETGHAHVVDGDARLLAMNGRRYLLVESPCSLVHEEHGAITLPEGGYEVVRQREFRESDGRQYAPVGD